MANADKTSSDMAVQSRLESTDRRPVPETAIRLENARKTFQIYARPADRLKQTIFGGNNKKFYSEFTAIQDVSLDIKRGETVGIIGRNGSGKSTLLQMICGILAPTSGRVEINGRIAALLELGAGFNPDFTGRENVYLKGIILGMTRKEIDERYESIVEFADIGQFIDQPVKTYSSGMYVRLAFATAINSDPDILVVDEALAVGDEVFQRKCFARIEQIKNNGATILFVSHNAGSIIQLCSRAVLLDQGEFLLEGHPKLVVNQYQRLANVSAKLANAVREEILSIDPIEAYKSPDEAVEKVSKLPAVSEAFDGNLVSQSRVDYEQAGAAISNVHILNEKRERVNILEANRTYFYCYDVTFSEDVKRAAFGMQFNSATITGICGATTQYEPTKHLTSLQSGDSVQVEFRFTCKLRPGTYFANAGVTNASPESVEFLHRIVDAEAFRVAHTDLQISTGLMDMDIEPLARVVR